MKARGLGRQFVTVMASLAVWNTVFITAGSYGFYYALSIYMPSIMEEEGLIPTTPELLWIAATVLFAVVMAALVARRFARRILAPLNSVAESIHRVAGGDLQARAQSFDPSLGEASRLVDDFNSMAEALERATREQAQWHAAIAHELRTPVTVLRGRLQGLSDGVFEPSPALFGKLLSQVEGLSRLIEDLRVLSLSESGHLHMQFSETDLAEEVRQIVDVYEPSLSAAGKHAELVVGPVVARCDPIRIRQALLALLENARKYAVPGMVRIFLGITDGMVLLRVEDEGPGLSAAECERVFEAFWRARVGNAADDGGGSGLGLAVVAAIARAHGGRVTCGPSALGGTAFELSWPIGSASS